jgi:hypothetical protein
MAAKIYEIREYEIAPGKMKAFVDRFANTVLRIFQRYEIKVVLFLDPVTGPSNEAKFILEWNSLAEREARWDAFKADPEWLAESAESDEDGPIVLRNICTIMRGTPSVMEQVR